MAVRDLRTGRIVTIRMCADALTDGLVVPADMHESGGWFCPEHGELNTCVDTFHAESRMAAWTLPRAWRAWRTWRRRSGGAS